jgi:hypothetical protein
MAQYETDLLDRIHALECELYTKPAHEEIERRKAAGEASTRATPKERLTEARSTAAQLALLFLGIAVRLEASGDRDINATLDEVHEWERGHKANHGDAREQIYHMHCVIDSLS